MWRELLLEVTPRVAFFPPAELTELERAERAFGLLLPEELRSLLLESNGLHDVTVDEWPQRVLWSIEEIVEQNLKMRADPDRAETYMRFDSLLFFADAGVDGILFAFQITAANKVKQRNIVAWYPIEDSRPVVAFSLRDYMTRWLSGELRI
jgi:hypothetical protein